jgi:hypothetical protein
MGLLHNLEIREKTAQKMNNENQNWSLEEMQENFKAIRYTWTASVSHTRLQQCLQQINLQSPITKVVAFALGSMENIDEREKLERSTYQHALLLSIVDFLRARVNVSASGNLRCYIQDPAYGSVDQSMLQGLGISTIDDPEGFLEVDEETVILSCNPDVPVRQIIADIAAPAIIIWNRVAGQHPGDNSYEQRKTCANIKLTSEVY